MTLRARDLEVALDRTPVLGGVSIDLRPGEILGIIGPNGAGKSTLLRTLAGLLAPSHGEVLADGRPLRRMRPRERAAHVAVVTQDAPLMSGPSVRDLVLMGRYAHRRRLAPPTPADHRAVDRALRDAGAAAFADRPVTELSGGERQLAQIGRALAQGAAHLLLDEPTSALDVHHRLRVFAVLRAQADAGTGVGIVLHDLNEASRHCDRIAVVHDGRLRAAGSPRDVLTPELLAEVYRIEARVLSAQFGYPHVHPLGIRTPAAGRARTPAKGTA